MYMCGPMKIEFLDSKSLSPIVFQILNHLSPIKLLMLVICQDLLRNLCSDDKSTCWIIKNMDIKTIFLQFSDPVNRS